MAANVEVQEVTGACGSPTFTTITSGRFCTADSVNPGLNNPIPIPDAGSGYNNTDYNYSFWKTFCLLLSGSYTQINNIRFYSDYNVACGWTFGSGGEIRIGQPSGHVVSGTAANLQYYQSSGTQGTTGYPLENNSPSGHGYYSGVCGLADFSGATYLQVDDESYSGAGGDERTSGIALQVKVSSDSSQGSQSSEVLSWLYDEI